MNAYINYLIEANLSLALLLVAYVVLLRKETDFNKKRLFMLVGIVASLLFPFLHLQNGTIQSIPSISTIIPAYWLPEVIINGDQTGQSISAITLSDIWNYLQWTYLTILLFLLLRFFVQLVSLIRTVAKSKGYIWNGFHIVESNESHQTFSFFNFIFIGRAHSLSADDKNKIVRHEAVHAKQLHSIDIVLLNVLSIFFWFNPLIKSYKKIFVQLHEFEADARAVENTEVNEYCSLLAKVALQSADYPLANYFNQSLTLKRIEMMRTLKHKIKPWKILTLSSVIAFLFFVVACQDQLADVNEITKNSTNALVVPDNVQARFEQLKKEDPNSKYILVEFNEKAEQKLTEMEKTYGLPKHIELFTPEDKNPIIGDASEIHISTSLAENDRLQTFAIIKYTEMTAQLFESSKQEGDIFSVVDEPATPEGGIPTFYQYISENMDYPVDAKKSGTQGKVFIEFIVNADGTISDSRILKGIGKGCDEEALRVMRASPAWIPAKLNGKFVRQKMVMPFNFQLGDV
jgi:TonB family protein